MTAAEKHWRDAAAAADAWAEKAERAGRLEDASTLCSLAAAANEKAGLVAKAEAARPPALRGAPAPDPSTACALCGSPGVRVPGLPLIACTNAKCIRRGLPVAASVF